MNEASLYEKTITSKEIYSGKIVKLFLDQVTLPNGKTASREIIRHRGAVGIIPVLDNGEILMVRQFRKPIEQALWEIPAGTLDPGELPLACGKRELIEETGYQAQCWSPLQEIFLAPGYSSEVIHLFVATSLHFVGENPDVDEILQVKPFCPKELLSWIAEGTLQDSKTITALLLHFQSLPSSKAKG